MRWGRPLLTGAAGDLGRELRRRLKPHCRHLRLSDIGDLGQAAAGEELVPARLEDAAAMQALLAGVGAVIHLGGVATERPWAEILPANIVGCYKLYEAVRWQGVKRVVFASVLVSFIRGGLSLVNILAFTFSGGTSGSSVADTASIGSVPIPEMEKWGYPQPFANRSDDQRLDPGHPDPAQPQRGDLFAGRRWHGQRCQPVHGRHRARPAQPRGAGRTVPVD